MIICASGLRSVTAFGGDPHRLVRLAGEAGFEGLAVGGDCTLGYLGPLGAAALAAGLAVPAVAAPLADAPLAPDRRLPFLASLDDSDERRAAVAMFVAALEAAVPLGVRVLTVYLGDVPLGVEASRISHSFARRELLDEDEPGARAWAAALGERRALSGLVVDACRYALDRILPHAERRDVGIAIEVASDPWSSPSPREAIALLDEYRSGPMGLVWDEGRMQVLANLGITPSPDRRAILAAGASLWRAAEAVGIEAGYLPGLGDPPPTWMGDPPLRPRPDVPVLVSGRGDSTLAEVTAARTRVAAATAPSTAVDTAETVGPKPPR